MNTLDHPARPFNASSNYTECWKPVCIGWEKREHPGSENETKTTQEERFKI